MADAPSKLTVEQQSLVSAIADEITETTSIHQQAIVRMLAVANEHNLNAANLLQDLTVEIKSKTARRLPFVVEDLRSGLSVQQAFAENPGIIPESALLAMAFAQSRGLQKPLNHTLLNTTKQPDVDSVGVEDHDAVDRLLGLIKKYIFLFSILSFIMLFIVPQFKAMFEEFGLELPLSMQLLVECANLVTQLWFVFPLPLLAIGFYIVVVKPQVITRYFTRWIPSRWQQPVLSKRVQRELSAAWVVQSSDDLSHTAVRYLQTNGFDPLESSSLQATNKTAPSDEFLVSLAKKRVISKRAAKVASASASHESAAWVLRTMSKEDQSNRRRRSSAGLRVLMWIGDFFMLFIAGWTAIAFFKSLILIIEGLT